MGDIAKDVTGVFLAIVSVAILYQLVKPGNQTQQVISSVTGGFATALSAAMGGSVSGISVPSGVQ